MIMPAAQNPHWNARASDEGPLNWMHRSVFWQILNGGDVTTGAKAGMRQEWKGTPSSQMVQAPQSPWSQPLLTPKQPSSRRKAS